MSETKEKKRKSSDDDDKKERKRAKRAENHKLKEQLPKTDENGIAYTKLQVRKMLKRVKRGLPPIPTKQEEQELKRQEAETRKEEEAEFAGLADSLVSEKKEEDSQDSDDEKDEDTRAREHGEGSTDQSFSKHDETTTTRKRKKRSKPVPDDYVCQACKNEHEPKHWIYDCPNKVTVKGTNHISKKLRGIHSPDNRKVFVSGLSFDMRKRDVELLFQDCGTIVHCKLLTFPDTGRCKGQAYVTFEDESSAKKAMQLSGTVLPSDDVESKSSKSKKKKTESSAKQKELKLKVTKVLNRIQTKHKSA
jgi:hypothetical protein